MQFYDASTRDVFENLKSLPTGLTQQEGLSRLERWGENTISDKTSKGFWDILINQFSDFLMIVLIIAAAISIGIEQYINAAVLAIVVVINMGMGFVQEWKAEKALQALKRISTPKAKIRRAGRNQKISARKIVPGDIVLLHAGDIVPADLRLFKTSSLEINEAILTGESMPSQKHTQPLELKTSLPDRENMAYRGTTVVAGEGEGVVVYTGYETEFGKIAQSIKEKKEVTPLQKRLAHLGKVLLLVSVILSIFVIIAGFYRGYSFLEIFSYSVALLVSAVPEGLPAITTLSLAIGVLAMAKHKAIVKKLPVIETLGSVDVLCVDKTGTLTRNEMVVEKVVTAENDFGVEGIGYEPQGEFKHDGKAVKVPDFKDLNNVLEIGLLANNAKLDFNKDKNRWEIFGDPTEGALKTLAQKGGVGEDDYKKILEFPFDNHRQIMSVVYRRGKQRVAFMKGEPKKVLNICSKLAKNGMITDLGLIDKEKILAKIEENAAQGYRILGMAYKKLGKGTFSGAESIENGAVFAGFVAMMDKPDYHIAKSVKLARDANIKIIIITGDHALTAKHIAEEIGMEVRDNQIITSQDMNFLNQEELARVAPDTKIFARISPQEKLKIVSALQRSGYTVAVTGDGVNDIPALRKADVGISLGQRGTDVANEVADIVLANDKFTTIIRALSYGRNLYENIRRFIIFLLSANFDEIMLVLAAFALGLDQPFTAIQVLWINLVTDLFPAFALASEPPSKEIIYDKPRDPNKNVVVPLLAYAVVAGIIGAVFGFAVYWWGLTHFEIEKTRTFVFTYGVLFELLLVFAVKSPNPFWRNKSIFNNKWLVAAVLASLAIQIAAIYTPLAHYLGAVPLLAQDWLIVVGGAVLAFLLIELVKKYLIKEDYIVKEIEGIEKSLKMK